MAPCRIPVRTLALPLLSLLAACGGPADPSLYTDDFFDLSIRLPAGWKVAGREAGRRSFKEGLEDYTGGDRRLAVRAHKGERETITLFLCSRHPQGEAVDSNPSLLLMAQPQVRQPGAIKGADDFLKSLRNTLNLGRVKSTIDETFSTRQYGDTLFRVMEVEQRAKGKPHRQRHCLVIRRGHFLNFVLIYTTDEELALLEKAMHTLSLGQ